MGIKHAFTSAKSEGGDVTVVRPSNWNADHTITSLTLGGVISPTPSSNQDNYDPSGWADATVMRVNCGASIKFTGLVGGVSGRLVTLQNVSTDYLLWLEHESASSTGGNRFTLPQAFPAFLMPGDSITLLYDGTASRWTVLVWPRVAPMGLTVFSDFLSGPTDAFSSWTSSGVVDSSNHLTQSQKAMGVAEVGTGTSTTGRAGIGSTRTGGDLAPTYGPALSLARLVPSVAPDGTETYTGYVGFADAWGGTVTDAVCWELRWTGSAAEWAQLAMSASSATRSTTGSPSVQTTSYDWFGVFVDAAWTRADFLFSADSASFSVVNSVSTDLPTNTQLTSWNAGAVIKSAGSTARRLYIDLAGYRYDVVSRG